MAAAGAEERALLQRLRRPRAPLAGVALDRPRLMGVVNVTPDSFSDGGRHATTDAAVEHALQLEAEGADILDIGGELTRPGSDPVDLEAECRRVLPVIAALAKKSRARISVDTRKPEVMRRAALEGAHMINDVSALTHDPRSLEVVAALALPVALMHAQGDPRTMQDNPTYDDVVLDVYDFLDERIAACERAGIPRARLVVDPGIGFGKTLAHNMELLGSLAIFHGLGCGLMLGASRKSFIGHLTGAGAAGSPARLPRRCPAWGSAGRPAPARPRRRRDAPGPGRVGRRAAVAADAVIPVRATGTHRATGRGARGWLYPRHTRDEP